jgi:hypothetical protein
LLCIVGEIRFVHPYCVLKVAYAGIGCSRGGRKPCGGLLFSFINELVQDAVANAQATQIRRATLSKAQRTNNRRAAAEDVDMINMETQKHIILSTQAIPVPDLWNSVTNGSQPLQRRDFHGREEVFLVWRDLRCQYLATSRGF